MRRVSPRINALAVRTTLRLFSGDQVLATVEVQDSPLGHAELRCLDQLGGREAGIDEQAVANLRRPLIQVEIEPKANWRALFTGLDLEGQTEFRPPVP